MECLGNLKKFELLISKMRNKPGNKSSGSLLTSAVTGRQKVKSIKINKRLCKKCEICVHFCPKKVFELDESLFPKVVGLEACNACKLCELRCPDFAIDVEAGDEVSVG